MKYILPLVVLFLLIALVPSALAQESPTTNMSDPLGHCAEGDLSPLNKTLTGTLIAVCSGPGGDA